MPMLGLEFDVSILMTSAIVLIQAVLVIDRRGLE